jgi:excinuclease UvrABC nuclease subunit
MNQGTQSRLVSEVNESAPRDPGVYAFCGASDQLLYIGKSVNLRQRMTSYFRQNHLTAEPRLAQLALSIRSFAWWQTRSELLALLLEDVLIKQHLPPSNIRQKEFAENRYLELTDDEFPACLIVEHVPDFGTREVFGPLRDEYIAATLQDILHQTVGVRTCSEPEPSQRCLEHEIGRCTGPCRGVLEPGKYQETVTQAREFLRGNAAAVLGRLVAARDRAAMAQRYEEAARLRDAIDTCQRYEARQRFSRLFMTGNCQVRSAEDSIEYRFENEALVAPRVVVVARGHSQLTAGVNQVGFHPEAAGRRAVTILHQPPTADRRFLADRALIVHNWTSCRADSCQVRFGDVGAQAG